MNKEIEIISRFPLFQGIRKEDLETMLPCLNGLVRSYKKEEMIQSEEAPAGKMGVVLSGQVQVIREDVFGNRNILEQLEAGELYGVAFACAGIEKNIVDVIAVADCKVLQMDVARILEVCPSGCPFHQTMVKNMVYILANKNVALSEKIRHLSRRSTREKLLSYLSEQSKKTGDRHFVIPFNRQELAHYLCVERSAMSAELGKLKAEGVLDFKKSEFWLR